jgi:hypothetical protein
MVICSNLLCSLRQRPRPKTDSLVKEVHIAPSSQGRSLIFWRYRRRKFKCGISQKLFEASWRKVGYPEGYKCEVVRAIFSFSSLFPDSSQRGVQRCQAHCGHHWDNEESLVTILPGNHPSAECMYAECLYSLCVHVCKLCFKNICQSHTLYSHHFILDPTQFTASERC